jgi:hypothetical protein
MGKRGLRQAWYECQSGKLIEDTDGSGESRKRSESSKEECRDGQHSFASGMSCAGRTIRLGLSSGAKRHLPPRRSSRSPTWSVPSFCGHALSPSFEKSHLNRQLRSESTVQINHVARSQQASHQAESPCPHQPTSLATDLCFGNRPVKLSQTRRSTTRIHLEACQTRPRARTHCSSIHP